MGTMEPILAATKTIEFIHKSQLPNVHPEYGKDHLLDMVKAIQKGMVEGDKAHRWLGYIQGCVCVGNGATLEDLKSINYKS